ncbi:MAG: MFS transporter [Planctomycetota bacterium]|nr:MFS transporter [Planctomycetota bacterium]
MSTDPSRDTTTAAAPDEPSGRAFGRPFWMLNSIEAFERLAYFGIRTVVPLYIMQATEPGGLHLTAMHKGTIYAWWAVFQSFLPIVTGGIADRYGYKRVLAMAISMNAIGYLMMANLHDYVGFFAGILMLATGTAFFKPALQGSIAQNLTKKNSSVGWGIFYWVVNVGAVGAPIVATAILGRPHSAQGWQNLFYACAGFTACNLVLLLTFRDVPSGADKTESPLAVLVRTIVNILEPRLIAWLAIMSCFWLMMYQLWDLHPNFITDWVDSSMLAKDWLPSGWLEYSDRGMPGVQQQMLLNLNAALIVLLMVPLSWAARKMRTLSAMLVGMCIATAGILVAGLTGNGVMLLCGIVFFSLGEMWTGPKKNEYLGLIAPPGKKALYLGYVNIPIGVGLFVGSYLAGYVYDNYGEKATLALKHLGTDTQLVARAAQGSDWSDSLAIVPGVLDIDRDQAFEMAAAELGPDSEAAAGRLQEDFRYDHGHLQNLCLQYLAIQPDRIDQVSDYLRDHGADLGEGRLRAENVAAHVEHLTAAVGCTRAEAFPIVRDLVQEDAPEGVVVQNRAVAVMLHEYFRDDPRTLDNLALEYLAQGTERMADAARTMEFPDPVADLPAKLSLGRTKSFAGLAVALGADDAAVDRALLPFGDPPTGSDLRPAAYLATLPHHRFNAIARRDWRKDIDLLTEMIESDPAAKAVVATADGSTIDYSAIAGDHDLIQKALEEKDWAANPTHAAILLQLNPYEARAQVAVEVDDSAKLATKLLWEAYHPQYRVWLPFAAIGVAAIIALAIFGSMAKRWKDMNA